MTQRLKIFGCDIASENWLGIGLTDCSGPESAKFQDFLGMPPRLLNIGMLCVHVCFTHSVNEMGKF